MAPDRELRTYVTAIVRVSELGGEVPLAIILPDGRVYEISQVTSSRRIGGNCEQYTVSIGGHSTNIWKDTAGWNGQRWYVVMRDAKDRPFARAERTWVP